MRSTSVETFALTLSKAAQNVVGTATGLEIKQSKSILEVSNVKISGDVGAFVSFKGDYEGIIIINFDGAAAIEIVTAYLTSMGMPPEDIPSHHTADDVRDNVGELVNQIMGRFRSLIQTELDLVSTSNIPAVVPMSVPIVLLLESSYKTKQVCMRIPLYTPSSNRFYIELAMESIKILEI